METKYLQRFPFVAKAKTWAEALERGEIPTINQVYSSEDVRAACSDSR